MNKAFRRSLLSLTAASAMASSAFAGNAAYLDVKVNYLNPAGTVVLGIDDDNEDNKQRDRVEILVTILDKDGKFASRDNKGKTLLDIVLKRDNTDLPTDAAAPLQEDGGIVLVNASGAPEAGKDHLKLYREMEENKNITRFVLDYTTFVASELKDTLEVSGGGLSRNVDVKLSSTNAKGLIVRVTKHGELKNTSVNTGVVGISANNDDNFINESFEDINVTDDLDLNLQSQSVPTGVAGDMIPLRVYASTVEPDSNADTYSPADTNISSGRFTLAPNLEGKTIVVQAMADYEIDGNASTLLNSVELTMKNGIASGEIKIEQGLPGTNALAGADDGVQPHPAFFGVDTVAGSPTTNDGLGITFVAYVKDDVNIANIDELDLEDFDTMVMSALNADTDAVVIRSRDPVGLKVGMIDLNAKTFAKLWKETSTTFHLMDISSDANQTGVYNGAASGDTNASIVMTVVDDLGNPSLMSTEATSQYRRWGNDDTDNDSESFNVVTELGDILSTALDFNGSDTYLVGAPSAASAGPAADTTLGTAIASVVVLDVNTSFDENGSASETLKVSYSSGSLSGMEPVELKFHKVEVLDSKITGNPVLADIIEVNTSTELEVEATNTYGMILSGLEPLGGIGSERTSSNIHPEFKAKLKVVAIDGVEGAVGGVDANATMTLRLTIQDPEKASDFVTSDYNVRYGFENYDASSGYGSLGYRLNDSSELQIVTPANLENQIDISGDWFEFNITSDSSDANTSLSILKGDTPLGQIHFGSFDDDGIKKLKGDSVSIVFKAYDFRAQEVYAEAYFETSEEPVGTSEKDSLPSGSVLKIKFSGEVSEGDKVEVDFNSSIDTDTTNPSRGNVFLLGEEYDSNDESNEIRTTLGADRIVSIVLYDTNASDNSPVDAIGDKVAKYGIEKLTINGLPVIYKTQIDDEDTDDMFEIPGADLFYNDINIKALDIDGAAKVRFDFTAATNTDGITFSRGDTEGLEDEEQKDLSSDVIDDLEDATTTSKPVTIDEEVETGIYYGFFGSDTMASIRDKYDNFVDTEETGLEDNFVIECSSGLECSLKSEANGRNVDSYIRFKPEAAGTTQTITFKVKENEEVTNSISFSNIRKSVQNTKFNITREIGHATFNVENSEVVIKIMGDGGKIQEDTNIMVTSDNKEAKLKLVPLAVNNKFFTNALSSTGYDTTIADEGSYFFVTSDKPGKVTVSVSGTILKDDSDTNSEVPLAGSTVLNFVAVDLDKPMIHEKDVTAIPSGITVKITDANLDTERTQVVVSDVNGGHKVQAEYKGNNTYTALGLPKGRYQVIIQAWDYATNDSLEPDGTDRSFVRNVTTGEAPKSPEVEVANSLSGKSYDIDGEFQAYDFKDGKAHLNWAYKNNATGKWNRLMGDSDADKNTNPFGWSEVDINPNDPKAMKWYMVKLNGKAGDADSAGKFGWAMISSDLKTVKKIASVKSDGSFEYLNITIKATMKDGKITFSK